MERLKKANEGLPTIKVKGKEYVMVKDRVSAFRREFPGWGIATYIEKCMDGECVIRAEVMDEDGKVKATGYAHEKEGASDINKTSYVENCETSAIGRALACLGIGIDDSFGSADEVAAALTQQASPDRLPKEKVKNLVSLVMKKRGVDRWGAVDVIQSITGKENSADLTPEDFVKVVQEVDNE